MSAAAELVSIGERLTERVLTVTVPVYAETAPPDGSTEPELVGSGVLVAIGQSRFLLTASHVLARAGSSPIAAGVSPEYVGITGTQTRLRSTAARANGDRIDVAIIRLEGESWNAISLDRFASWSDLDMASPLIARHTYVLVGFPNSVNRRVVAGNRLAAGAYRMASLECDENAYRATNTDPMSHVMVGFEKDRMIDGGGLRSAPALYGASGGGLWRCGRRLRESAEPPKLSAVATEWHPKGKHRHILGTRIQLIVHAMSEAHSDVRDFIANHAGASPTP